MSLPESAYDRHLTQKETKQLLVEGWKSGPAKACCNCYGKGCDKCYNIGLVVTLYKDEKFWFGVPPITPGMVGAGCRMNYYGMEKKLRVTSTGAGGSSSLVFHYNQLFEIMKLMIDSVSSPEGSYSAEFGVEAEFRGPPSMKLAALTKNGVTVSTIPDENQAKAVKLLKDAGLHEEARLLAAAFEHEVFRGDEEENKRARAEVGEIEPGTIFKRRGNSAVMDDGSVINVDGDKSLLAGF